MGKGKRSGGPLGCQSAGRERGGRLGGGRAGGATMARLPLPLLPLLLAWPSPGASQDTPAACDPDGCFAVFAQRRSFLDAWHGCRELGGNLATLKRAEEAARVAPLLLLLRGSGSGAGAVVQAEPRLFWIGLHRQPRQCFPGRPLRGFTWTTGDQETAYTNWASAAADGAGSGGGGGGGGACNAQRCVALDDREALWVEGSCVIPLDGYVCRFPFQRMCPGLDDDEGSGPDVAYTTPFGRAGGGLSHVPFGTVAAVACGGAGPALSVLCLQKEDGAVAWSKEGPLCREDVYRHSWCEGDNGGCQQLCLDEGSGYSCECHAGYRLMPDGHSCAAHDACVDRPCQFGCVPLEDEEGGEGGYQCQCPAGYEPGEDDPHQCEDVDECVDEASCEHQCENTEGAFVCRCHLGFSPSEDDPGRCVDTDECQFSGVCQQMCVNYEGGFECYCSVGYELEPDGISCSPGAQLPPLATPIFVAKPTWLVEPPVHIPATWEQDSSPWVLDSTVRTVSQAASPSSPPLTDTYSDDDVAPSAEPLEITPPHPDMSSPPLEPTTTGFGPPAATGDCLQLTTGPQNSLSHPAGETGPGSPRIPLVPTAAPLPDSSERGQGAVAGGVRALLPNLVTPSPASGEEPGRQRRDDRWLLVALLVPICVFVVIMLALGIVYCTRCGAQAKARSVTQCYRWVINSAGKGAPPPTSRPCQPATCRTSV